jgi:hypothetical protein
MKASTFLFALLALSIHNLAIASEVCIAGIMSEPICASRANAKRFCEIFPADAQEKIVEQARECFRSMKGTGAPPAQIKTACLMGGDSSVCSSKQTEASIPLKDINPEMKQKNPPSKKIEEIKKDSETSIEAT